MNLDIQKNNLHYYIDLLRGKKSENCEYALYNVIRTMNISRHSFLCGEDFSNLDWGNIPLNNIYFSNNGKNPSTFDNSKLNELNFICGHSKQILCSAYSPDNKSIVSCDDNTIIWNVETTLIEQKFRGHTDSINSVTFSPNGKYILTGSDDKIAILQDLEKRKSDDYDLGCLFLLGHTDSINSVTFSQNSEYILTGSSDKTAILWDVATGESIHIFEGHTDSVNSVAFSQNSEYILTGSSDKTAILWDVATGKSIHVFEGHTDFVNSVVFSPNDEHILTVSKDKKLILWNILTGEKINTFDFKDILSDILTIAFFSVREAVLIGTRGGSLISLDLHSGKFKRIFYNRVAISSISISNDDKTCLISSYNRDLFVFNIENEIVIKKFLSHSKYILSSSISINRTYLMLKQYDSILIFDLNKKKLLYKYDKDIYQAVFSLNEKYLITQNRDDSFSIFDLHLQNIITSFKLPINYANSSTSPIINNDNIYAIDKDKNEIIIYNIKDCNISLKITGFSSTINNFKLSSDNKTCIVDLLDKTTFDRTTVFCDIQIGKHHNSMPYGVYGISDVIFLNNKNCIAYGRKVFIFNSITGELLLEFSKHKSYIEFITLTNDKKHILSGEKNGTVICWELETGKECYRFNELLFSEMIFISQDSHFIVEIEENIASLFETNGQHFYDFFFIDNINISNCTFNNIVCPPNDKTKEIIHQQGGFLGSE